MIMDSLYGNNIVVVEILFCQKMFLLDVLKTTLQQMIAHQLAAQ